MSELDAQVFPTVAVSSEYGKYVDDIDIDLEKITEYLRAGGLSDEKIMNMSITLAGNTGRPIGIAGRYYRTTQAIETFHLVDMQFAYSMGSKKIAQETDTEHSRTIIHELEHRIASFDKTQQQINQQFLKRARNKYTLRHAVIPYSGLMAVGASIGESAERVMDIGHGTPLAIGITAVGSYLWNKRPNKRSEAYLFQNVYLKHPEEIRCRTAEEQNSDNIVSSVVKQNQETFHDHLGAFMRSGDDFAAAHKKAKHIVLSSLGE